MEQQEKKEIEKEGKALARWGGLGFQMAAIIGLSCWLGVYLDKRNGGETKWWTIGLSLFGIACALYLVFKEVSRLNK